MITIAELSEYEDVDVSEFSRIAPIKKGVYYFYDKYGEVIYIGKTKSFRQRFMEHRRSSYFFAHVVTVRLFSIEKEVDRDIYETYFINVYQPEYNKGKMWRKADDHDYQQELYELEAEIDEIDAELECIESDTEFFDEIDECSWDDDVWEDTEYEAYDSDDRLLYALGDSLHNVRRVEELTEERQKLINRIRYVKSFVH